MTVINGKIIKIPSGLTIKDNPPTKKEKIWYFNFWLETNIIDKKIRKINNGSEIPNVEFSIIFGLKMNNDAATNATLELKNFVMVKYIGIIVIQDISMEVILWIFINSIILLFWKMEKIGDRKIGQPNLFITYPSGKTFPLDKSTV